MIINKRCAHFHNCKVLFLFVSSTLSEHPGVRLQGLGTYESAGEPGLVKCTCVLDPHLHRIQLINICKQAGLSEIYICGNETSMIINKAGIFPTLVKLFSCFPDVCKALALMNQQVHMVKCTCMYPSSTLHL